MKMGKHKKLETKPKLPKKEVIPKKRLTLEEVNEEKLKLAKQEIIDRNPHLKIEFSKDKK